MGRKCNVCEPQWCSRSYLYVLADDMRKLVKIGRTVNIARRMAQYRANGNRFYRLVAKVDSGGCDFTAGAKEARAILALDQSRRVRGDWFDINEQIAVDAVNAALRRRS